MTVQIQLRRGTASLWTSTNPVLAEGEVGEETDTKKAKIGDGVTAWVSLPYWVNPTITPVTSVTGTSPIASSGGATPAISIQTASGSQDGALSSTDWTTFNSKQAGPLTGDVTTSGAAATIANDAVTFAKMQNIATNKLLGRGTASTGDIEEITLGTNLSLSGTTVNAANTSPGGSNKEIQFNASGVFDGDQYLNWNDTLKFMGVQNTAPESPIHVSGITGQTVDAPSSASATATLETLIDSPTSYAVTQVDAPANPTTVVTTVGGYIDTPFGLSASETSDGASALLAQGQTWYYRLYAYKSVGGVKICNGAYVFFDLTDTINDNNPVRVDLSWTAPMSDYDGYILVRNDNLSSPQASLVIAAGNLSYADYGFTDTDAFVVSAYLASGVTYTQQVSQYKTLGGVPYTSDLVTSTSATDDGSNKYLWLVLSYDALVNDGFQVVTYNSQYYENLTNTTFVDYGQTAGAISPYATFASAAFPQFNTTITPPTFVDETLNYFSGSFVADGSSWEAKVWSYRTALDGTKYFYGTPLASGAQGDDSSANIFSISGNITIGDESGNVVIVYQNGNAVSGTDNGVSASYSISGPDSVPAITPDITSYTGVTRTFRAYGFVTSPTTKYSGTYNSQSFTDTNPSGGYMMQHVISGPGNATGIKVNQQTYEFVHLAPITNVGTYVTGSLSQDGDTTVSPGTIGYTGNGDSYNYTVFATKTINGSAVWSTTGATASVTLPNDSNKYTISLTNASVSGATYKAKRQINSGSFVYQTYSSSPLSDTTLIAWNSSSTLTPTSSPVPAIIADRASTSASDPANIILRNTQSNAIQTLVDFQANQAGSYTSMGKVGFKDDGTLTINQTSAIGTGNIDFGGYSTPYVRFNNTNGNVFNVQNLTSNPTYFKGSSVNLAKFSSSDNTVYFGNVSLNYDPSAAVAIQTNGTTDHALLLYPTTGASDALGVMVVKNSSSVIKFVIDQVGKVGAATSNTGNGNVCIGAAGASDVQLQFQSNSNLPSGVSRGLSTQGTALYWSGAGSSWRPVNTGLASSTAHQFWRSDANGDAYADNAIVIQSGVIISTNLQINAKQGIALDANKDISMNGTGSITGPIRFENSNKTANFTLGTQHTYTVTSGTVDATLPTAASIAGREYEIVNSGTGVVTLKTTSSQTVGGLASGAITLRQYQSIKVVSDGSNWQIEALPATVGNLFCQTATGTIANSTTETAISSTGVGSLTLPANFFVAGKTIRICGRGYHSSASAPTIRIKVKFGSTVILDTTAVTSGNDTNAMIEIAGDITCRTTGASGTVFAQGQYHEFGSSPNAFQMVNTATVTVDTTASQAITVTAQWGTASASNTISLTNLTVEALS